MKTGVAGFQRGVKEMQKKDAFYCYAAVAAWCLLWWKRMSVTFVESRSHDNVKQAVLVPPQYAPAPCKW